MTYDRASQIVQAPATAPDVGAVVEAIETVLAEPGAPFPDTFQANYLLGTLRAAARRAA